MYIFGGNAYHGDIFAALLEGGDLVAAGQEEWIAGFPSQAIQRY